jgi:hypothetical protein
MWGDSNPAGPIGVKTPALAQTEKENGKMDITP